MVRYRGRGEEIGLEERQEYCKRCSVTAVMTDQKGGKTNEFLMTVVLLPCSN